MATTTTLLLVLATTAALFFDLAAARCRVMMFMPGYLEEHDTTAKFVGIATEKSADKSKIEVLDAAATTFPSGGPLVHVLFGTKPAYKWYTAVKKVDDDKPATIAHDSNGNYNVFKGPTDNTITTGQWTGAVTLDPVGKASPKEIVWIAFVKFVGSVSCDVLSVYINEEPSFRSGPMRYVKHKGNGLLDGVKLRSQQKFKLQVVGIDATSATNGRLFYGYGTFENAEVAMDVHFQIAAHALVASNAIVNAAGFNYHDYKTGGTDAALTTQAATDVIITGDAHSLGWIAAYDPTLREFAFYQKMAHMGDGFHNGKLTMGTHSDATTVGLEGTIVFASRDKAEFILYLPTLKEKAGQDAIRAFYGKKPWSDDMETALDKIGTTPADDAANGIYLSGTTFNPAGEAKISNNAVNKDPGLFKFALKPGDTCGMVKWVAFRQTKDSKKYLAHRDMTKKM